MAGTVALLVQAAAANADARPGFMLIATLIVLATLLLPVWELYRGNPGGATAWAYIALPLVLLLALIAYPFVGPDDTGNICEGAGCNHYYIGFWLGLACYLAAFIATWVAIRATKGMTRSL